MVKDPDISAYRVKHKRGYGSELVLAGLVVEIHNLRRVASFLIQEDALGLMFREKSVCVDPEMFSVFESGERELYGFGEVLFDPNSVAIPIAVSLYFADLLISE